MRDDEQRCLLPRPCPVTITLTKPVCVTLVLRYLRLRLGELHGPQERERELRGPPIKRRGDGGKRRRCIQRLVQLHLQGHAETKGRCPEGCYWGSEEGSNGVGMSLVEMLAGLEE